MSKISKNELKRNELKEWIKLTTYYFQNNIKVLIITITSITFIIIATSSILYIKRKNNKLSAEILANAINTYHLTDTQTGKANRKDIIDSISYLKNLLEKYPNTHSASIAYYYLGNLNYELADYDQSLLYYQDFIKKYSNHSLIHTVQKNIANVYELQNNLEEAVKIYENMVNASDIGIKQKEELKLNLARVYELQNQSEKAIEMYSELENNEEAQFRLSCLSDK